jgi:hypothetical protein
LLAEQAGVGKPGMNRIGDCADLKPKNKANPRVFQC